MTVHGFWGLQVAPGKQYSQKVTLPFMITMASLTDTITSNKRCSLLINVDGEEFILCSLTPGKLEQQVLTTVIMEGEEVTFSVKGDNTIHLTGNHVFDIVDDDNGSQCPEQTLNQPNHAKTSLHSTDHEKLASCVDNQRKRKRSPESNPQAQSKQSKKNDNYSTLSDHHHELKCEKERKKLQSCMDSLNGHVQQLEQQLSLLSNNQQHHQKDTLKSVSTKKSNMMAQQNRNEDQKKDKKKLDDGQNTRNENKKQLDDHQKQLKIKKEAANIKKQQSILTSASTSTLALASESAASAASTSASASASTKGKSTKLKVVRLPNGMVVEDKKIGIGRPAGTGSKVGMQYHGKLLNGKKFDATTSGTPFRFTVGKAKVIRGWDIGVAGMKVGGERKLVIPPALAYGRRGAPPDIPPNSTLVFDVKLVELV